MCQHCMAISIQWWVLERNNKKETITEMSLTYITNWYHFQFKILWQWIYKFLSLYDFSFYMCLDSI